MLLVGLDCETCQNNTQSHIKKKSLKFTLLLRGNNVVAKQWVFNTGDPHNTSPTHYSPTNPLKANIINSHNGIQLKKTRPWPNGSLVIERNSEVYSASGPQSIFSFNYHITTSTQKLFLDVNNKNGMCITIPRTHLLKRCLIVEGILKTWG